MVLMTGLKREDSIIWDRQLFTGELGCRVQESTQMVFWKLCNCFSVVNSGMQ